MDSDDESLSGTAEDIEFEDKPQIKNYTVLTKSDIRRRQEDDITTVSTVLSVPRSAAAVLLFHFAWSITAVQEAWFADEDAVRKEVGLIEFPSEDERSPKKLKKLVDCPSCDGSFPPELIASASCGHPYCTECWKAHIRVSLDGGPGCLMMRCPEPDCDAAVTKELVDQLASDEDKKMFDYYLIWCYAFDNKKIKWCPAKNCDQAVEFEIGEGRIYDVQCDCSHEFCWNCTEEAHNPLDCETVARWISKRTSESENMKWVLANSKPCPKCHNQIEKNQGNMHMKCRCKFEFCWLCLGEWSGHSDATGGFYACNVYEVAKFEGVYDEVEKKRQEAKRSLEKYPHYYNRWATNHASWQRAVVDLQFMKDVNIKKLSGVLGMPESSFDFLVEAWKQIVECRRVLKWTYAYGYFLPDDQKTKKQLFEYLQGEAEAGLEKLHQYVEDEMGSFLEDVGPMNDFSDFRLRVLRLTRVTRNFFKNLVKGLENRLADVDAAQAQRSDAEVGSSYHLDAVEGWMCDRCTFMNPLSVPNCTMCSDGFNGGFNFRDL